MRFTATTTCMTWSCGVGNEVQYGQCSLMGEYLAFIIDILQLDVVSIKVVANNCLIMHFNYCFIISLNKISFYSNILVL